MPIPNDYLERVYAGVLGKIIGVMGTTALVTTLTPLRTGQRTGYERTFAKRTEGRDGMLFAMEMGRVGSAGVLRGSEGGVGPRGWGEVLEGFAVVPRHPA